jgi:hypothetical protein
MKEDKDKALTSSGYIIIGLILVIMYLLQTRGYPQYDPRGNNGLDTLYIEDTALVMKYKIIDEYIIDRPTEPPPERP